MGVGTTIKEYAKLARSFNMALTGMSPVFGALAMEQYDPLTLLALFFLGCGAHIFGFVLNDYIDIKVDKHTDELSERPLVSGTITPGKALAFALFGLVVMLGLGLLLTWPGVQPFLILLLAAGSSTVYNLISKRAPGMDLFVALAVGLLTIFGSSTVSMSFTPLAIDIALLALFQVLFMNIVANGLKDIDHDFLAGGRNLAIATGCKVIERPGVRAKAKKPRSRGKRALHASLELVIPAGFKTLAHTIEVIFIVLVLAPFVMTIGLFESFSMYSVQFIVVVFLGAAMLAISTKLMGMRTFVRSRMRKLIGLHYSINFSLVPVMLSVLQWWIFLFALAPPLGFVIANKALHGQASAPKTM
jgi:4-hydroxybenzoate polyprenyltransferase